MTFTQELIEKNLSVWQQCLDSPFLQQLGAGTLDEACFKGYIVDDSLYLREYAKVFAWGMTKAEDLEAIRTYYSLLSFVNEGEGATRLVYLMVKAARDGQGAPECMMACLPCMVSYQWIFQRLLQQYPNVRQTPFWPLVRDYTSDAYEQACQSWLAYTDRIRQDLDGERKAQCSEIFRECSLHELHFWEMSLQPRTDLP